jgi:predicted MFS family arabinose efflux permease
MLEKILSVNKTIDIDSKLSIFTIVILGMVNIAILYVAPVLIGAMVEVVGFTEAKAGYVISAELLGMLLATFPALYYVKRISWRKGVLSALIFMICFGLISASTETFQALLISRFLFGLAAGFSMAICLSIIGLTSDPDRTFGFWVTGQLIMGALGLFVLPTLFPTWGFGFVYTLTIPLTILLIFMLRFLPNRGREEPKDKEENQQPILLWAVAGLLSIFVYYTGQFGVWAYIDRIGSSVGLGQESIGESLGLATIIGIGGSLGAAMLSSRFGRLLPIAIGVTLSIIAMTIFLNDFSAKQFLIAACIFNSMFNFVLPYLMACVAAVDMTGKLIILTSVSSSAGLAAGPALAALVQQSLGFNMVITIGVILSVLSVLLVIKLAIYKTTQC